MKIETKRIIYSLYFPLLLVVLLWIINISQWDLHADWSWMGIFPRQTKGLPGILSSPLIHADLKHLFSNSVPLIILGWCLFYFYKDLAYLVFPIIWISSGFVTWCIGRDSWHIGASGLVYALSFFLFFSGILRRYIPLMAISLLVVFLHGGGLIFNMLPVSQLVYENMSWEAHLSGAITGLLCSVFFRKYGPQKPLQIEEEEDMTEDSEM